MKTALILGKTNGVGLDRDAVLLEETLRRCGFEVELARPRNLLVALRHATRRADLAFHLERVAPGWWRRRALRHILIPNQERFPVRLLGSLRRIDEIWCKSSHAREIFQHHHPQVRQIGFSSPDRMLAGGRPDYQKFLHLAGRSTLKNTGLLLELWARHPEWPRLTLVQHPSNAPKQVPGNIELISRYLPDEELRELQNACGIHLCPSLSEGWGHYIVEAMSCRALVVTTDAPPMNELVGMDRGWTVPFTRSEPRHLGRNFFADPQAMESAIEMLRAMSDERKESLGAAARQWFEANAAGFQSRVADALNPSPTPDHP